MTRQSDSADEAETLRARAYLILDVFEQAEPSLTWARLRAATKQATRLSDLRIIHRELRGAMAGLDRTALAKLRKHLLERFGPDADHQKDKAAADKARQRGRIRSESEYRAVQAYADSIAADFEAGAEFDALSALLDDYASRPAT